MRRYRIAVVGCGSIASGHLKAIHCLSDRFKLVGAVDPKLKEARSAPAVGDTPMFASDEEMYHCVLGIEAVSVCTPHYLHADNIRRAVDYGVRGILVEKPVTTTLEDMDDIITLTEERGVKVAVGYILRHSKLFIKMAQLVHQRCYGAPFAVTCRTEQGHPGSWFDEKPWIKTDRGLGRGGSLFSHGCHYVDLMIWMMGRVVRATKLSTKIAQGNRMEGTDTSFAIFEFENGGIGHMFSSWGIRHCESVIDYRIYCQGAQLIYDQRYGGSPGLYVVEKHGQRTPMDTSDINMPVVDASAGLKNFLLQYARFYDSMAHDTDPEPGLRVARESMEAIWAAVDASAQDRIARLPGRQIHLPPFDPI